MCKKLTKEVVNERIASRGLKLIGEYVNTSTKSIFQCLEGHQWNTTPGSVMGGCGCPICKKLTKEVVNERIASRGLELVGEYVNVNTKTTFQCLEGHQWNTTPGSVMHGRGCPHCAGKAPLTKEEVNKRLAVDGRGLELVGEYLGNNIKSTFQCSEGHSWDTKPSSVMGGRGCPTCATNGFNPNKYAILYYIKIETLIYTLYKIGITNNSVKKRFPPSEFKNMTVISEHPFENGQDAYNLEQCIHKLNKPYQYKGEKFLKGGNTELYTNPLDRWIMDIITWWSKAI